MVTFPAAATINLDDVADNISRIVSTTSSAVMSVVKADGYGHGIVPVALAAVRGGATWLGVAQAREALNLRNSGVDTPILTWMYHPSDDVTDLITAGIDITVVNPATLATVQQAAIATNQTARVHLKVDSGLGRNGQPPAQWPEFVAQAKQAELDGTVHIAGLWSHLACADEPDHPHNQQQKQAFDQAIVQARDAGLTPELIHLANSAATLTDPQTHYSLVRVGLATYGLDPAPTTSAASQLGLRPVMTLAASLIHVKELPEDHPISYGCRYRTTADTTIGVVPLGYADGIPRHGTNKARVGWNRQQFQIAGTVCMDQFMVDLGHPLDAEGNPKSDVELDFDDEVVRLFGPGDYNEPSAHDWAEAIGTINYEIVTRLGARVPRRYVTSSSAECERLEGLGYDCQLTSRHL